MNFLEEFKARGLFYQCTGEDALNETLEKAKIAAYIGFDPTASSLHVGSLMQIMIFRLMQKHGIRPIAIIGGATGKIGDPSFRDNERQLLSDEDLANNLAGIKSVISKFITFGEGENDAIILDNNSWFKNVSYIDFLRDYGRHFSVNRMLSFDSVKTRLEREQNLSFLEFNYSLLQAYDFIHLAKNYNCTLQIGGSDQWGNIVSGTELGRKLGIKKELFGLTTPLITTASGKKMGKTAEGAIWLSSDRVTPYDYYQFWRNTEDLDVIKFIKIYTEISLEEIEEKYAPLKDNEINIAKKRLAFEATKLCHGEEEALKAEDAAIKLFEFGSIDGALPEFELEKAELENGIAAYLLFSKSGLCESGGEAKRIIKGGGARINDQKVESETQKITLCDLNENGVIKLSAGKKKHMIIKII